MTKRFSSTDILQKLRTLMKDGQNLNSPIQAYIVPSCDAHNSEYLADCDKFREFVSGFSGSYGTVAITDKKAVLWTDGRYVLQASQQLDSNWMMFREGDPVSPTIDSWLCKILPSGSTVGIDGKTCTYLLWRDLETNLAKSGITLVSVPQNLLSILWKERATRPCNPLLDLSLNFSGKTSKDKIQDVRNEMLSKKMDYLIITALDEIAWALNLRGTDIPYNPVFFAYLVIKLDEIVIFITPERISGAIRTHLEKDFSGKYTVKKYEEIEGYLKDSLDAGNRSYWFSETCNAFLVSLIPRELVRISDITPIALMKAIKNETEVAGMKNAHVKDGAALCSFFCWLEEELKNGKVITEISAAQRLEEFRAEQADFMGPSFATISSVGPHGAIIHYSPEPDSDVPIKLDEFYLCDSGGQYRDGTTDVTRTFHYGTPTNYERECYTRVLKGQLKLAVKKFPLKIKGSSLDVFCREALWDVGLDYEHGSGHGIGMFLNVHEGPMFITWKYVAMDPGLEPNMFLSNEPGYYENGQFGIRIEDIVQVVPAQTKYSHKNKVYLTFNTITVAPKQTKHLLLDLLTDEEINQINDYHQKCRELLTPLLDAMGKQKVKKWLYKETEAIVRS